MERIVTIGIFVELVEVVVVIIGIDEFKKLEGEAVGEAGELDDEAVETESLIGD
jgi:hypothetical protein